MIAWWNDIDFANKHAFWLFLAFIPALAWYVLLQFRSKPEMRLSSVRFLKGTGGGALRFLSHIPFLLRLLALSCVILIVAKPESNSNWRHTPGQGIDIILALDVSPSMLAKDLRPTRLDASKNCACEFIDHRPDDRIGAIIFSAETYTLCPLTMDHKSAKRQIMDSDPNWLEQGTAIGNGLALAVKRIKDSDTKSKVIVLLTDGVNTAGDIDPRDAGKLAKHFGVRVYTIGAAGKGRASAFSGGSSIFGYGGGDEVDEDLLEDIASTTGGKYFRATNRSGLQKIYEEIDKMEKTEFTKEHPPIRIPAHYILGLTACVLLILEYVLRNTAFRSLT